MARNRIINYAIVFRIIGILLIIEGVFIASALPFSVYYGIDENLVFALNNTQADFWPLLISSLLNIGIGLGLLSVFGKKTGKIIGKREGYIIVSLSWIIISLFGALPFVIGNAIPSYADAFFETMSGFTTTGSTILRDIESMPKGLLYWRSMTHWIGGMGIIVLSVAILPFLGIGGMQLFIAEVPGPTPDKLHPRITATAKRLWIIYVILTGAETLFLVLGGMNLFDGLCHAFGTMATGGFSTKNTSVTEFSPYIQYVIIVFMLLAGTNFTLHYLAIHGKIREVIKNEEFKGYLTLISAATIICLVILVLNSNHSFESNFRHSLFTVVSIITTTGFVTTDYLLWPVSLWFIVLLLMFIGGSAGSTGGGIKVVRYLLLIKNSKLEMKRLMHPQAVLPVRMNGKPVSQEIIYNVLAFFLIYILIFSAGTLVMSMMGLDFATSIGTVVSTLGNIGPGFGNVGPVCTFANIPLFGKWVLSFLMLLGRLELFTVLILFAPSFWKR